MDVQEIFWLFVNPLQAIRGVRDFLELGGDVLLLIMITTFVLWGLIFERYAYFRKEFIELTTRHTNAWQARKEHKSWAAHRVRETARLA